MTAPPTRRVPLVVADPDSTGQAKVATRLASVRADSVDELLASGDDRFFVLFPAANAGRGALGVHAISHAELLGWGIVRRGTSVVLPRDCFPGYVERRLAGVRPHAWTRWFGALRVADLELVGVPGAVAAVIHPNLVYGHFLLEMLPRIWLAGLVHQLGPEVCVMIPERAPGWLQGFLRLLFPGPVRTYDHHREVVAPQRLLIPTHTFGTDDFHPAQNLMVSSALAAAGLRSPRPHSRLYLSRRRLGHLGWHSLANEEEVEAVFEAHGFEVVHPQELDPAAQLRLYGEAQVLAGEFSSATHNALFAPFHSHVIVLNQINGLQARIAALRRQHLHVVPPSDGVFRTWSDDRRSDGMLAFSVDPADVQRAIEEVERQLAANKGRTTVDLL